MKVKIGDKLVYSWLNNHDYFTVETIEEVPTEEGDIITIINGVYSLGELLRKATKEEIENNF